MTTPVQQARDALGARLREIRKDADLTARALAAAMGTHFTKVSKIENGARSPTEQDIRSWCAACGAAGQVPDLIATVRHIEAMYHEKGYRFVKGDGECRDVRICSWGLECDCGDATFRVRSDGCCKHRRAVLQLRQRGELV